MTDRPDLRGILTHLIIIIALDHHLIIIMVLRHHHHDMIIHKYFAIMVWFLPLAVPPPPLKGFADWETDVQMKIARASIPFLKITGRQGWYVKPNMVLCGIEFTAWLSAVYVLLCSCMCSLYSECVLFLDSVLRSGTGCIRGCAPRLPLFPPPFELTFDPVIEGWWSLPHSAVSTQRLFPIKLLLRRRWLKCRFSLWHNKCDMWWLPIHPLDQSKETHEEETHGGARPGKQDNCFLHWPPSPEEETWDRKKDFKSGRWRGWGGWKSFWSEQSWSGHHQTH